jgi:molybdopterin-containing oxidoreductase family iron-sulfur binding subunit
MSPHPSRDFDFDGVPEPARRRFLKLMAASIALASGCARERPERILPYGQMPEQLATGRPLYFATALSHDGYGCGVLVESEMGRPIKVEGNPHHPASLGGTDAFAQAAVLALWDPDRSRAILQRGAVSTWDTFRGELAKRRALFVKRGGAGLHILTGAVSSPTLATQLRTLLERYPRARWHQHQPVHRDNVYAGTQLAFGAPLEPRYDFTRAQRVLSLDGDFLSAFPGHVRYARDFNGAANPGALPSANNRLYVIETTPTLTGAKADHCRRVRPGDIDLTARVILRQLGIEVADVPAPAAADAAFLRALILDLMTHRGASVVLAGDHQPPHVHALAHLANERLGNAGSTVEYIPAVMAEPLDQRRSLQELTEAMAAGEVEDLLILGVNPVYATPADVDFARHLRQVPFSVHLGAYRDETARATQWHVPEAHELERWGDIRAFDGTASVQQPLVLPLYGGRSTHEVLGALGGEPEQDAYARVRNQWRTQLSHDEFERAWKQTLHDGVVEGSRFAAQTVRARPFEPPRVSISADAAPTLDILFRPDPCVHDGRYTNNAWLQELPKPLTELTWDNAAILSAATAKGHGLENEDVVEITHEGRRVLAPVWILPGQADGCVTLHLGYGRTAGGEVAAHCGFNAYSLQTSTAPAFATGAQLRRTGARQRLATAQLHNRMEGRDLARSVPLAELLRRASQRATAEADEAPSPMLYPPFDSPAYAWAMSINLDACIGCKACTIACQAENNIPVVGKDEVLLGREMHWIRVDRYFEGPEERPRTRFQPVPCMHCERAPCEVVCPVEASIHDADGLNVQVYNRCVGTRFCSNNCPYKVRRFNFLQYSKDVPELNAQRNPDVTVRMRGVMEKCTYCLQRIAGAKIEAEKQGRRIRDGEVITACQAVCPTQAIVFGDLNDPTSSVRQAKQSPHDYALLAELNTLPRTTYLPAVDNPNPALREAAVRDGAAPRPPSDAES